LEEWKYNFVWGIWVYEDGDFTFLSEWDLAIPNGDVDTYHVKYIVDEETLIVDWNTCMNNVWLYELKNGSDMLKLIK
jgi:hypothetical protein